MRDRCSKLPSTVSADELTTVLSLLKQPNPGAGSIIWNYFRHLEIEPAYERGSSWIKDAMPRWFDKMMESVTMQRMQSVREVMDA
jgi:hypothetical protein